MKIDLEAALILGFSNGKSEIGGAPKVIQWIRLKYPVSILSSDLASGVVESMWEYNRAAMAPPAECRVISKEHLRRLGFSWRRLRSRAAIGFIHSFAAPRNPE